MKRKICTKEINHCSAQQFVKNISEMCNTITEASSKTKVTISNITRTDNVNLSQKIDECNLGPVYMGRAVSSFPAVHVFYFAISFTCEPGQPSRHSACQENFSFEASVKIFRLIGMILYFDTRTCMCCQVLFDNNNNNRKFSIPSLE